ncbi:MFS general substrate transporter [Aulographum hederae CBS 113979]|uniref:MFS general substrate transporter n=1 Tax=Aulographum hederae CBS 113979 TaxID=1176131 RepID=A0A6G1H282_9PEZI|nr:MFS general substrate transporter [Aulographum hederae CBS 113979]
MASQLKNDDYGDNKASTSSNASHRGSTEVDAHHAPSQEPEHVESSTLEKGLAEEATAEANIGPDVNHNRVPNGGWTAWLQVLGSFFLMMNNWGIINTFGVYQTYYESSFLSDTSPSTISWLGSIQGFLLLVFSAITGPVYDAGYFRELIGAGSFLLVFGHMMLSLCTEYWQVFLAQGLCIGLGTGLTFVPSVAILATYFDTRLATSMGVAAAGSSLGGVIYPIVLHRLFPVLGFGWTVRVLGFMVLATCLVPNVVMKMRLRPAAKRKLIDWSAFRELPYSLFTFGCALAFAGLYVPFFYVQTYAITQNIMKPDLAFYLLSILNASSIFGRLIPNRIADIAGALNVMVPLSILAGVVCLCLIASHSVASVIVLCVFYGFCSGALVSIAPTVLVHLSPNRAIVGTRMGMCFAVLGCGVLVGSPIAGAILDSSSFTYVWVFGGCATIVGALTMGGARIAKLGLKLRVKG